MTGAIVGGFSNCCQARARNQATQKGIPVYIAYVIIILGDRLYEEDACDRL
jgi:hypothetical protein